LFVPGAERPSAYQFLFGSQDLWAWGLLANPAHKSTSRQFRLRRVDRLGSGIFTVTPAQNRNYALADGFHRLAKKDNTFPLFLRYKAQAERHYRRAVEEFEPVKALREFPEEPISDLGEAPSVSERGPRSERCHRTWRGRSGRLRINEPKRGLHGPTASSPQPSANQNLSSPSVSSI
jgi:hypothetical protein